VTGTGPTPQYHGATFGGGFERYFTDTISARAEYRGTHLETLTNLAAPGWTNLSAGGTVHTLRAVLSYRIPTL
jgi:outer membrane immunogenic protein